MASLLKPISVIAIMAFTTFLIETQGDVALIEGICKLSQDFNYCNTTIYNDPRSNYATLDQLSVITSGMTKSVAREALTKLDGLIQSGITDLLQLNRTLNCHGSYTTAVPAFDAAFNDASLKLYMEAINRIRVGFNGVLDCKNAFLINGPIGVCPVSDENSQIIKLAEIVLLIIQPLLPPSP